MFFLINDSFGEELIFLLRFVLFQDLVHLCIQLISLLLQSLLSGLICLPLINSILERLLFLLFKQLLLLELFENLQLMLLDSIESFHSPSLLNGLEDHVSNVDGHLNCHE